MVLGPLVLGGGSVSYLVREGKKLLELRCSRVSNVNVEDIRPLKILGACVYSRSSDFELFTEMCLLDPGVSGVTVAFVES